MAKNIYLSVIIPVYNEEGNLPKLWTELKKVLSKSAFKSEVIFVDDGSFDNTASLLRKFKDGKVSVQIVTLKKNSGQTAAISSGIARSSGKIIGLIDADLQNDPADLLKMLRVMDDKTDAVVGWRKKRHDGLARVVGSKLTNHMIRLLFGADLHDLGCATKIVRKDSIENIRLINEHHRLLPAIFKLEGLRIKEVVVNHRARHWGKSKYTFFRPFLLYDLINLKLVYTYGSKPSGFFGPVGLTLCAISFIPLFLTAYDKLFQGIFVHRNPLFIIAIFLFFLGIQFLSLGFIAELVIRKTKN